jgi:hypothetical protein
MSNNVTTYESAPGHNDGFTGSLNSGRVGNRFLRWTDSQHWLDRDGVTPPSPVLVVAVNETVRRWKDGRAEDISDRPLPDPELLNASIPESDWEKGRDGKPRPPYAHTVHVKLVNLATGEVLHLLSGYHRCAHRLGSFTRSGDHNAGAARHEMHAPGQSRRAADEDEFRPQAEAELRDHRVEDSGR